MIINLSYPNIPNSKYLQILKERTSRNIGQFCVKTTSSAY